MKKPKTRLTRLEKNRREKTWQVLLKHNAPCAWDPNHVDVALNNPPPTITFTGICKMVSAHWHGKEAVTEVELRRSDGQRMLKWLKRQAERKLIPALRDDGSLVLFQIVAAAVADFRPTVKQRDGWKTQGFAALLHLRAKRLYRWAAKEARYWTMEEGVQDEMWTPRVEFDLRAILVSALMRSAKSPMAWDCLYALAYRGSSLRELARRHGIHRSTFSRTVASPLVAGLREQLAAYRGTALGFPSDIAEVAQAVAMCFSKQEYRALIPRPRQPKS